VPPSNMEQQTVAGELAVRVGDVERDACVEKLIENCVQGRLSVEELGRRQREALEASTAADLARLVADLPAVNPSVDPLPSQSAVRSFWPASSRDCAVKLATVFGVPATFVTGGVLVAAYANGSSDVSQFSWAVVMGAAGYLTHWVVAKFRR
jgi:hypothetical protein